MDTNIGPFTLTGNQVMRLETISFPFMNGLSYQKGNIIVVSDAPLTAANKTAITSAINGLSNAPIPPTPGQQVSAKPDASITTLDLVTVLREKGIL